MAMDQHDQNNEETPQDPQIHVDEGWKETVAAEREKLRNAEKETGEPETKGPPLPEPSLQIFMAGLYTQCLMAMGLVPNHATGETSREPAEAAYLIDTIAMLQEKMQGNLSEEESAYVEGILYDLRMRYVTVTKEGEEEQAEPTSGEAS
jgi:hypothetical protein